MTATIPTDERDVQAGRRRSVGRWIALVIVGLVVVFFIYSLVIFIFFPVKFWGGL